MNRENFRFYASIAEVVSAVAIVNWEIAFYSHSDGVLHDGAWDSWNEYYTQRARRQPKFSWTENRHNFIGGFADHVDAVLQE